MGSNINSRLFLKELERSADTRRRLAICLHNSKRTLLEMPCPVMRREQLEVELAAINGAIAELTRPEVEARQREAERQEQIEAKREESISKLSQWEAAQHQHQTLDESLELAK